MSKMRPVLLPQVIWRNEGEKYLYFNPETRGMHFLQPLAHELVQAMTGEKTVDELTSILSARYGLSEQIASRHVTSFIKNLQARKLISLQEAGERLA